MAAVKHVGPLVINVDWALRLAMIICIIRSFQSKSIGSVEPIDIDDYDPALDEDTRDRIQQGLFRRMPELRGAEFNRGWGSIYTITDDWHPVVGDLFTIRSEKLF